jgi:hypothetical protein
LVQIQNPPGPKAPPLLRPLPPPRPDPCPDPWPRPIFLPFPDVSILPEFKKLMTD